MADNRTRKKDKPGEPVGDGTGGSFASIERDDAPGIRLRLTEPTGVHRLIEEIAATAAAATRCLHLTSAKVIADELRKELPSANYLYLTDRSDGPGNIALAVHDHRDEEIARFTWEGTLAVAGEHRPVSEALSAAVDHIPNALVSEFDPRTTLNFRDYEWLDANRLGALRVNLDDALATFDRAGLDLE